LEIGRVLTQLTRFAELIDEVDVAARACSQAQRTAHRFLDAVREGVGQRAGRTRRQAVVCAGYVGRDRRETTRAHAIFVREGVLVRRVEDSITAAQNHFVAELVSQSEAGGELLL